VPADLVVWNGYGTVPYAVHPYAAVLPGDIYLAPAFFQDPDTFYRVVVAVLYDDTEVLCVHADVRYMPIAAENRVMKVSPEWRRMSVWMEALEEDRGMDAEPRKRVC
jgi:hypothetical protein